MTMTERKAEARKAAFARRAKADPASADAANRFLLQAVRGTAGRNVSAYWPMRTEIDPRPTMMALAETHRLCLPVVSGQATPLTFRRWTPGDALEDGGFGTGIPSDLVEIVPDILIVPLAAFNDAGYRLGYGGGFYDRTLEGLRALAPVTAIGFAYDIQRTEDLPHEATDQPLDMIATESGITRFAP